MPALTPEPAKAEPVGIITVFGPGLTVPGVSGIFILDFALPPFNDWCFYHSGN